MAPVVGGEDNQGITGKPLGQNGFSDAANASIHRFDHGRIGGIPRFVPWAGGQLFFVFGGDLGAGFDGSMDVPIIEVYEKRPLCILGNKADYRIGKGFLHVNIPIITLFGPTQPIGIAKVETLCVGAQVPFAKTCRLVPG